MATLGDMRTRIADELQIDQTTFLTDIDRAIFSAIEFYNDRDFWFLDTAPTNVLLSATTQYSLLAALPGRSEIRDIVLQLSPGKDPMIYRTRTEWLALDFSETYTGVPLYWSIYNDSLMVLPLPNRTYTAVVWYSLRNSMTASASASSVWTNEAEELIRLHAEADILQNRMKDFTEAVGKAQRETVIRENLDEKTVVRRSSRRIKPHM